jgi:hypothetical protein
MYDRDLRTWYRDLFLRTSRRRPGRNGLASDIGRGPVAPTDGAEITRHTQDLETLRNHERPQATH